MFCKLNDQIYKLKYLEIKNTIPPKNNQSFDAICRLIKTQGEAHSLHEIALTAAKMMGFDGYTYGCLTSSAEHCPVLHVSTLLPLDEWKRYHAAGLMGRDRRFYHCSNHVTPGTWNRNDMQETLAPVPGLAEAWSKHGLASGVFFPIHGGMNEIGMLSFNSCKDDYPAYLGNGLADVFAKGLLLSAALHEQMVKTGIFDSDIPIGILTEREREMLMHAANGHDSRTIATMLGVTERTINFHCTNLMEKLGVKNRVQAVSVASCLGLIKPHTLTFGRRGNFQQ